MQISTAFDTYQTAVNASPAQLKEGRRRRDLFKDAFGSEPDVDETFPSGSLARGSMLDPIHDVDIVVVYDAAQHPDWGVPGDSAASALSLVGSRVNALLGASSGTLGREVRLASPRNHAVKCFLDDPDDLLPFTVDAMPALRQADGTLLIPEKLSDKWVPANPEDLLARSKSRQTSWNKFVPTVRDLKHWNRHVAKAGMKSLVVELLAHQCIPSSYSTASATDHRPEALLAFFTAAAVAVDLPVVDPAGLCWEVQPDLDRAAAKAALQSAADGAYRAVSAMRQGDDESAIAYWGEVLGPLFPKAPTSSSTGPTLISTPRPLRDTPQG